MRYICELTYFYGGVELLDGRCVDLIRVSYDFSVASRLELEKVARCVYAAVESGKIVVYKEIKSYARIHIQIHSDCPAKSLPTSVRDIKTTNTGSGSEG